MKNVTWNQLTPEQRAHITREDLKRRRPNQTTPARSHVAGVVYFFLEGPIPGATHHDKKIGVRFNRFGQPHPTLQDSPALVAARNHYAITIKPNSGPKLAGPVGLTLQFRYPAKVEGARWKVTKPDVDNLCKTLLDVLVKHGWFDRDDLVSKVLVEKIELPLQTAKGSALFAPGVYVACRTLATAPTVLAIPLRRGEILEEA